MDGDGGGVVEEQKRWLGVNGDDGALPDAARSMAFCILEQLELLWDALRWK